MAGEQKQSLPVESVSRTCPLHRKAQKRDVIMNDFASVHESLLSLDPDKLLQDIEDLLVQGISAQDILDNGLISGMDSIGEKMQSGEMFIPEVLMAAQAMGKAVERLKPLLAEEGGSQAGKVLIGTVKGDLHDIGKNLVIMMLEGAGFEVKDLGVDVDSTSFISEIKTYEPDLLALSALLSTTMPMMESTVRDVAEAGVRDSVKVMVGGAPVTEEFAQKIGADGYAEDAGTASRLARSLVISTGSSEAVW